MKQSAIIGLSAGLLLITLMVIQSAGQSLVTENTEKYTSIINAAITKCQNKKVLLESRSPNIRRQAIMASIKGAYLKMRKKELVSYLISVKAAPTTHRVEYFLNKHFYQSIKPEEMVVLLETSQLLGHVR